MEEISAELELQPPTISHHLRRLKELDLVTMRTEGNLHYYSLNRDTMRSLAKRLLEVEQTTRSTFDESADAYSRKVMKTFVPDGKIKALPASAKKRMVILKWLVEKFEQGRKYSEKELSEIIKEYHPDYAALRRYMVDEGLMKRADGIYWRV